MSDIKVVIVDDHKIVRDGIMAFALGHEKIKVIGEAGNEEELLSLLDKQLPDVIVLDISLPGKNGIEITKDISKRYPTIKILILSAHDDERVVKEAIKAGAIGFLHKDCDENEFLSGIEKVSLNQGYFGNHISSVFQQFFIENTKSMIDPDIKNQELTQRETEVLKCLAEGCSDKKIAEILFISLRTVETHKKHIREKLKINSTAELVKYAIKNGIIDI